MLTESDARDLLAQAAATIDVPPGAPLPDSGIQRRRWLVPVSAAAAAVLLIATGVALMRDDETPSRAPTGATKTTPDAPPAAAGIPPVFAYDANSAEQMLAQRGLVVSRKPSYTCLTAGRAVRTTPATGAHVAPGHEVTLWVTEPGLHSSCRAPARDALAWQLLDFANGRGPAPTFAPEVTVYVDGQRATLTGDQAANPNRWTSGSALGLLATASRQVLRGQGSTLTPLLTVHPDDGTQFVCGGQVVPSELAGRQSLWLSLAVPTPGFISGACTFGNLYQTNGQIDAIVVRASDGFGGGHTQGPVERDPDPDRIAARFLAYARGSAVGLPVGASVRLYLGNEYQKTISAADIGDRNSFRVCAAYAGHVCPMSAVATLAQFPHQPLITDSLPAGYCLAKLTKHAQGTAGSRMVVLKNPNPLGCIPEFAVQIWSNDVGQITAVNLLLGEP